MACANGHFEIVKLLVESKATVNFLNESNNTPLHWACLNGRLDIVNFLLENKADPNLKNIFDKLPIEDAL
jgi:ankyrin repeat protein